MIINLVSSIFTHIFNLVYSDFFISGNKQMNIALISLF